MKIRIPNPKEFLGREDMWFEQLDLAIYHAKKSWSKLLITYSKIVEEGGDLPWINFVHSEEIEDAIDKSNIDPDYENRGDLEIEIVEP